MPAIILSIGDELCLGQTVDTNSAWVSAKLAGHGIGVYAHQTVADDRKAIELAIRWAAHNADAVLISGGIGPTEDDLTRFALADAMGVGLAEDAAALEALEAFFRGRGRPMPERNRVQAMCPEGAVMLPNPNGTAPGIRCHVDRAEVFVMPGVPREMRPMFSDQVLPAITHLGGGRTILTTKINAFGSGESNIAEMLGDLMSRDRNPTVGTTVSNGYVSVRLRAEFDDTAVAQQALEHTAAQVEAAIGPLVFGRDDHTLQQSVIDALRNKRMTLATAESCTGGLIGGMLTDVPGASSAYLGGWTVYDNAMKTHQLGVSESLLDEHGAVSAAVVRAMAEGALQQTGADLAVSVSGIAGPDGGTDDKPVGTVYFGLAYRDGDTVTANARRAQLPGSRSVVRDRAAKCALQWVRLHTLGHDADILSWAPTADE